MKKILLLGTLLMLSMVLLAFTPVIDGVKDAGWGTTPTHSTTTLSQPIEFNLDGGVYITDDPNFVYIGIPTDNDPWNDGKPVHFHVAIDLRNTTGGGTSDAWGSQVHYGQTYLPEFDIISQWSTTDENVGWTGFQTWHPEWSTPGWSQVQLTSLAGGGGQFTEIALPRSVLGNIEISEIMNISVWARPAYDKQRATVCLPAQAGFTADWGDSGASTFTVQFPYTLTTLLTDMIDPQVVSLTQLTDSSFNITFNEPMKEENALEPSNYTPGGGFTISSITEVSNTVYTIHTTLKLTGGNTYTLTALSDITDVAGNPIDAAHNSASLVALYYSNVTFQVNMNVLIISGGFVPASDQVYVRGEMNGWGTSLMSDSNSDGIYDVTLSVAYGTGGTFAYKYWNNHLAGDNWESISDRSFTIVGVDNIIPVVYWSNIEPSGLTTHSIDVTFQVNMVLEDTSGGVFAAGDFNSWNGTANPMTLDTGTVFTATITYPAYSVIAREYKFVNGTTWEYINNRTFNLDDAQTTMLLPVVYFNDSVPTDLTAIQFMPMSSSLFTNFNSGDALIAGSNVQIEVKMTPVDINANSQYSATLHYRPVGATRFALADFVYSNTFENDSYWQVTLTNGVDISDGDAIEFYVSATDYNGPELVDDNNGAYYTVSIASGGLPAPTNVQIIMVGHDAHISWDAVSGATSYRLYYFSDPSNPSTVNYYTVTNPSIIIGALDAMNFFHVTALQ
jgi:hypothetical protein